MSDTDQKITELPIDQLQPNPLQPRGSITADSLQDLVESIKKHGILEPLVIAHTPAGYQIVAGERRWRAAKLINLDTVPVIVKETSPRGMLEMALVENVQRTDLNPIERAKAFERLMTEFDLAASEIADRIGKSNAYVSNTLRLLKLPDALKDGLLTNLITEGHARALAAIDDTKTMVEAYKIILKESGSVRRAEDLARRMKHLSSDKKPPAIDTHIISEETDRIQEEIRQTLGEKDNVKISRSRQTTKIMITLRGTIADTRDRLERIYKALASPANS